MSEYIEIETEISDDGMIISFYTNLRLVEDGPESYHAVAEMEEGSPVAQALAVVNGIVDLRLEGSNMTITRKPEVEWHVIVAEVSAVLKDFFL